MSRAPYGLSIGGGRPSTCKVREVAYLCVAWGLLGISSMDFISIDTEALDDITGGAGEGLFGALRVGLVGISLATGNPEIKAPQLPPRIEVVQPVRPG